jgi:hypothetical protein
MGKTKKYYKVRKLSDVDFKRVVGVKINTFKEMVKVVRKYYRDNKAKGGTTKSLSSNDEILMMLEYYREYRTFKHIGVDYGVSESTAHYTVTKIEKILIKESKFHLKTLKRSMPTDDANELDIVVVDVTESECERPKKSKKDITLGKRKDILKKHK